MRTVLAIPGMRGIDTVAQLTASNCYALKDASVDYVERYLNNLTVAEIENNIFPAGLLLACVSYSRMPRWIPSLLTATSDVSNALYQAKELGIPQGATLIDDLESPGGTYSDIITYGETEAEGILSGGYDPGVYAGYRTLLTSAELYALPFRKYQHSCSRLVDRFGAAVDPSCGWCSFQLYPPNMTLAGLQVDMSFCQNDYEGRAMVLVGPS
jgi:hypothetical protein